MDQRQRPKPHQSARRRYGFIILMSNDESNRCHDRAVARQGVEQSPPLVGRVVHAGLPSA